MSKIVFQLTEVQNESKLLFHVYKITGIALGEIKRRMQGNGVLVEMTLFNNDHVVIAGRILKLLEVIADSGSRLKLFELEPEEDFDGIDPEMAEISEETLRNILESWEEGRDGYGEMDTNVEVISQK